ncbi:MAG: hypothetical protein KAH48_00530 [Chlorobi bacterium]|nr:hypothetical protein [Chlorobiota bacterium]
MNPDTEGIDMPAALINFHLPIHINKTFRIEPEFGFYSGTNDFTELRGYKYVNSLSYYRVGIGGFYTLNTYPKTSMYIGPRICILFSNFERKRALPGMMTHSENILEKAVMFGASFGGEYVLTNYLSLGMELQLNYYNYYEQGEFKFDSFDKIVSKTNGLIFLRIYLF